MINNVTTTTINQQGTGGAGNGITCMRVRGNCTWGNLGTGAVIWVQVGQSVNWGNWGNRVSNWGNPHLGPERTGRDRPEHLIRPSTTRTIPGTNDRTNERERESERTSNANVGTNANERGQRTNGNEREQTRTTNNNNEQSTQLGNESTG